MTEQNFHQEQSPDRHEGLTTVGQLAERVPALYEDYVHNIKLLREKDPSATLLGVDYDEETGALSVTGNFLNIAKGEEPFSVSIKNAIYPVEYESNTKLTIVPFERPGRPLLRRTLYEMSLTSVNVKRKFFWTPDSPDIHSEPDWTYLTMVLDPLRRKEVDLRRPGTAHTLEYPHNKEEIKRAGEQVSKLLHDTRPKS